MDPIQVLMDEHQVILRGLDALEAYVEKQDAEPADLALFVKFVQEFADACHHGKEEDILFKEMQAHGFPAAAGPLAVMMADHEEGRRLTGILKEAAGRAGKWSAADRKLIRETACTYAAHLRQHIEKEDNVLYPMAKARLPAGAWEGLAERFESFEEDRTGSGEHERLHKLAEDLIHRYGGGPAHHPHRH
jgi:hemerythrin-like domain-containing protein